jgi:hypothetical protein
VVQGAFGLKVCDTLPRPESPYFGRKFWRGSNDTADVDSEEGESEWPDSYLIVLATTNVLPTLARTRVSSSDGTGVESTLVDRSLVGFD